MTSETLEQSPARAAHHAEMLKALSHPIRLRVVALLCGRDFHVNELTERLGVEQALVSQHLRILRMAGVVQAERKGGFARYTLKEPRMRQLIACIEGCSHN